MIIYRFLNRVNGMSYIGQSTRPSVLERYGRQEWWKATHNLHLKRAVSKYGPDQFEVQILESGVQSVAELDRLEQHYIRHFNTQHPYGYNFTGGGDSIHSLHETTKAKISERQSRTYDLVDWRGREYRVSHLKRFCQQEGLVYQHLKRVLCGDTLSSQGFALKGTPVALIKDPTVTHTLQHVETGEIVTFGCIAEFARGRGLESGPLQRLLAGQRKLPYCGWIVPGADLSYLALVTKHHGKQLRAPDGQLFTFRSTPLAFAREHPPLRKEDVYLLLEGRTMSRKGWQLSITTADDKRRFGERSSRCGTYTLRCTETDEVFTVTNLSQFCQEHGLHYETLQRAFRSGREHGGIQLVERCSDLRKRRYSRVVLEHAPTGETVEAADSRQLWNKMRGRLAKNRMYALITGAVTEHEGWTLIEKHYE